MAKIWTATATATIITLPTKSCFVWSELASVAAIQSLANPDFLQKLLRWDYTIFFVLMWLMTATEKLHKRTAKSDKSDAHNNISSQILPADKMSNINIVCNCLGGWPFWSSQTWSSAWVVYSQPFPLWHWAMYRQTVTVGLLFFEILTRCSHRIRDFLIMRYINLHFTYLLTNLLWKPTVHLWRHSVYVTS